MKRPPDMTTHGQLSLLPAANPHAGAVLSPCGAYRYRLWRLWDVSRPLWNFVLLNPSLADAERSDPTLQRCCQRAEQGGAGGLYITNGYALRSVDPAALRGHADPVGPSCDQHLLEVATLCELVICGWGHHIEDGRRGREAEVVRVLERSKRRLHVLGLTSDGHPRHPLYLPYTARPEPWVRTI